MTAPTSKVCRTCRVEKPLGGFYRRHAAADGRDNECIECAKAYQRKRRERRRAEIGDEAYAAERRESVRRSRARRGMVRERLYARAVSAAQIKLAHAHPEEYRALLDGELRRLEAEERRKPRS